MDSLAGPMSERVVKPVALEGDREMREERALIRINTCKQPRSFTLFPDPGRILEARIG